MKYERKFDGYIGKWYCIDHLNVNGTPYSLWEHCTYGDETCHLLWNGDDVIEETWDSIPETLACLGVECVKITREQFKELQGLCSWVVEHKTADESDKHRIRYNIMCCYDKCVDLGCHEVAWLVSSDMREFGRLDDVHDLENFLYRTQYVEVIG